MKRKSDTHLQDHFSFVLWYVSVNDVCLLSYVSTQRQFVGVTLSLAEHHRPTLAAAVDLQHGADGDCAVVVAAADCKVLQLASIIKSHTQYKI